MLKFEKAQKQELHEIAIQRRRLAIRLKEGEEWEHARRVMSLPSHETHDNATLEMHFSDLKGSIVNHDEYLAALKHDVMGLTCAHDRKLDELAIYIETRSTGTLRCTPTFFNDKTLTELHVFLTKLRRATPIAELLKERLWLLVRKASPEVVLTPWAVRFIKSGDYQTVYLDDEKLRDYPTEHLVWLEHHLLNSGAYESKKAGAAMQIQEYARRRFPSKYEKDKNRLKGHKKQQPIMPTTRTFSQAERFVDPHIVEQTEEGEIRPEDED
jgi:hypothetical protein